jgi:hypothetical protein
MLVHYMSRRLFSAITILIGAFLSSGCSVLQPGPAVSATSSKVPQSEEMTYADPLKMKILRCYWTDTVSPFDDTDMNLPAGAYRPTKKAQDAFLVVELALTNYGDKPMSPVNPPWFELHSQDGKSFERVEAMNDLTQKCVLGSNINPGKAFKAREVFDVPKGQYDLNGILGTNQPGWRISKGPILWVWELSPTTEK